MNIRPTIKLRYGKINSPLQVALEPLVTASSATTFFTSDTASGVSSFAVKSIVGFTTAGPTSDGKLITLLLGEPGNDGSEIITTHASTIPAGVTITLKNGTTTAFPHSASTPVRVLAYDQVELYNSTTLTGSKTLRATVSLLADGDTQYNDVTSTSGYFFGRFKNSNSTTYSDYSDPAPFGGYTLFSARSCIDNAKGMLNKEESTSDVLTEEYAFQQIDSCQMEVLREFKRWSFMQSFNYSLGETTTGTWRVALPTDCDDQNTNKSVWGFRIGKQADMMWVDKEDWNYLTEGIAYTTLNTSIVVGATSVVLTDSSDFDDTGTAYIGANTYAYTANNRTTNTLTISASTTTNTAGQDCFQGASFGYPTHYTIWGGYIYHYPVCSSDYDTKNYYLDYWKSQTQIIRDSDNIVLPDATVVHYYLAWKFLLKLNNGEETEGSKSMYNNYLLRREKMKQKEALNREFILH